METRHPFLLNLSLEKGRRFSVIHFCSAAILISITMEKIDLSTEKFSEKFESGEFRDNDDYIIRAGIYEMVLLNEDD